MIIVDFENGAVTDVYTNETEEFKFNLFKAANLILDTLYDLIIDDDDQESELSESFIEYTKTGKWLD